MAKLLALIAVLASPTGFHSSAKPLPAPVKAQLKSGGFWHKGCPVGLSGLRLLTVSHRGWDGRTHTGQLIVNARAAQPLRRMFRQLYRLRFPIRHMRIADFYGPKQRPPEGRRRDRLVRVPPGRGVAVHRRRGHRHVVAARLRPGGRRQPGREPLRRLRAEPRPDAEEVPRPLAPPEGDGDPARQSGVRARSAGAGAARGPATRRTTCTSPRPAADGEAHLQRDRLARPATSPTSRASGTGRSRTRRCTRSSTTSSARSAPTCSGAACTRCSPRGRRWTTRTR